MDLSEIKFTQEVKDKWLKALKSGEYLQGSGRLMRSDLGIVKHCCLGVLCEVHPLLGISTNGNLPKYNGVENSEGSNGYRILSELLPIGIGDFNTIWETNDEKPDGKYTKVIPLIEAIPINS